MSASIERGDFQTVSQADLHTIEQTNLRDDLLLFKCQTADCNKILWEVFETSVS